MTPTNSMYALGYRSSTVLEPPDNGGIAAGEWATLPTAGSAYRGVLMRTEGGAGVADTLAVVLKNSSDGYDTYYPVLATGGDNISTSGMRRKTLTGASVLTLTEDHSGALIECGVAEDFVLPTITAHNIGMEFEFLVTATATTLTVTAATAQLLHGGVTIMSTSAGAENDAFSADATDDLVFTMNGTTTGGIIGSYVRFTARSVTKWLVHGNLIGSGTIVTPFGP